VAAAVEADIQAALAAGRGGGGDRGGGDDAGPLKKKQR
jgi:hypothetical protein